MQGRLISKLYFLYRKVIHSIPILHNKTRSRHLRYASYSIPLTCTLALLLLLSNLFIINPSDKTYAADEAAQAAVNPQTSLTIAKPTLTANAAPGSTAYVSSNVTYSASDVDNYTLQVSYAEGYTALTREGGTTSLSGAGTTGVSGNNLADDTWGFAWGKTSAKDEEMSYYTMPSYGSIGGQITRGRLEYGTNDIASTTKKLVFAAKFSADNAESGHYKTSVQLSLTASSKLAVTGFGDSAITTMQEMTNAICENAAIGTVGNLEDTRDGSIYSIRKHEDGRCWMTRNLKLTKESIETHGNSATLTNENTHLTYGATYTMPATLQELTTTDFSADNYYASQIYYPGDVVNGAYYSFTAATAESGDADFTEQGAIAPSDICPKGWKLPTNTEYYIFLRDAIKFNGTTPEQIQRILSNPYNFVIVGVASDGRIAFPNTYSYYWTNVLSDSTHSAEQANYLFINTSSTEPALGLGNNSSYGRYAGRVVRCIAENTEPQQTLQSISTMQEMTPEICANTAIGTSKTLTDSRDSSTYTVGKLSDGKCWMTQNLRIINKTVSSADSDSSGTFTIPASSSSGFTDANTNAALYSGNTTNGAYYSWYTVTAGSGTSTASSSAYSICPKGWRLPTKEENDVLGSEPNVESANGIYLGGTETTGSFYPFAKTYNNGSLGLGGTYGYYWSSTADYIFRVGNGGTIGSFSYGRNNGVTARCIVR